MTKEFLLLIRLFSVSAKGVPVDDELFSEFVDTCGRLNTQTVGRVMAVSMAQNCFEMTDIALQDIFVKSGLSDEAKKCLKRVKLQIMSSATVTQKIYELMRCLEKKGIEAKLLKGMSLSHLYAVPECRTSCDTDILIPKKMEKQAYDVFKKLGYEVTPRTKYSHHATCTHPGVGTVELHTDLFFDRINDVIFDNSDYDEKIASTASLFTINGTTFKTLGITENLIYVTFHMIQHFIRSGTSIRQLYDILIYCKAHKDEIDHKQYFEYLDRFSYRGIYDTVMTCGILYFGFNADELLPFERVGDDVAEKFLSDIEHGGWIGKKRDDGYSVFRIYGNLKAKNEKESKEYKKNLKKYQLKRMVSSIFPEKERLIAQFPFAKNPLLRIPAWFAWLFYGISLIRQGELSSEIKAQNDLTDEEKERLLLFEQLGIIKSEEL